jgi:hypothetical protein
MSFESTFYDIYVRARSWRRPFTRMKALADKPQFLPANGMKRGGLGALVLCMALLAGCNMPTRTGVPQSSESTLQTLVAAQLTQVSQQNATATMEPESVSTVQPTQTNQPAPSPSAEVTPSVTATITTTPQGDNVQGEICYPGGNIPAMNAYFEETTSHAVVELPIAAGQDHYATLLPPGTYLAYAWLPDFSYGGLYSQAVPCGLKADCKDHQPLPFEVKTGETLQNIDLCDWYAGPYNIPYPPGKEATQITGSISGALDYPAGTAPELHVVAFNVNTHNWYYVVTNPGASTYRIDQLPPGSYQVAGYDPDGNPGGHADASHNLIDVSVKAGEVTSGVDLNDWHAPPGDFPPDPTR